MSIESHMEPVPSGPQACVTGHAPVDLTTAWARFVPIDLTKLFHALGPLPAVVRVSDQSGPWDVVGNHRRVGLSDGTTITERITLSEPPQDGRARLGYTVTGFGGVFGRLTQEARGFWVFAADGGQTEIAWRYRFEPTSVLARPVLATLTATLWRAYMQRGLSRTVDVLSTDNWSPT